MRERARPRRRGGLREKDGARFDIGGGLRELDRQRAALRVRRDSRAGGASSITIARTQDKICDGGGGVLVDEGNGGCEMHTAQGASARL